MNLRALLVDGGATLFPEGPTVPEYALLGPGSAVTGLLPELERDQLQELLRQLGTSQEATECARIQPTDALTAELLEATHPGLGLRARTLRQALARAGWQPRQPYPGAIEMLVTARELGLATVLVSNTAWLCEEDYWERLEEMALADHLDYLVSSFDVGVRKPNRAMFDAAVERAGCSSQECVMVGDSEPNDIEPAADLGMRTIRVTMQYPVRGRSRADAVADSLDQIRGILQSWCADPNRRRGRPQAEPARLASDLIERRHEVEAFVTTASHWAKRRSDVVGIGVAGSWARGTARTDSDVDLILLTSEPRLYTEREDWTVDLGAIGIIRRRRWGAVTERRLILPNRLEIEVGVGVPSWASIDPLDPGTRDVVTDGFRILYDRHGSLTALAAKCAE